MNELNREDNKRPFHLNLSLNSYENEMLIQKSNKAGIGKSRYIRELICSSCPVEAPPPQFYHAYNDLNKIGININQIAALGNATGVITKEDVEYLKAASKEIKEKLVEIKTIVLSARPYSANYFERKALVEKEARKKGTEIPLDDIDIISPHVEYKDADYLRSEYPANYFEPRMKRRVIIKGSE